MENLLKGLNSEQAKAVTHLDGPVLIVAGPGSGKTRVLTHRVAHLISQKIPAENILAVTFTNKAANEMKERLNNYSGDKAAGVHVSTIHALCVRILREDGPHINLPRNFTVLDQDDQKSILKEAIKEKGIEKGKYNIHSLLDYVANNKAADISVERALELAGNHFDEKEKASLYQFYVERQTALYALDFDDLLLKTVKMFAHHPKVLEKWQHRFNFIHVDEFQDIDQVQYTLIKQLANGTNQVYVVGDPDQTIYTWRGADVNIIMQFEKDFSPCETIVLNQNYRSTPHILNGANSLIKYNQYRVDKDLFTTKESDEKITHCSFSSEDHETKWIANTVKKRFEKGGKYKEVAILYRANYLSRSMEKACLDAQIPYIIYGGTRFYDRAEVKDMLSYLRMITHSDDLAFLRSINMPRRGIGDKTLDTLRDKAKENKTSLFDTLVSEKLFSSKIQSSLDQYTAMIIKWKELFINQDLYHTLEMVANESGLRTFYEANNETDRLENIKELINDVLGFQHQYPEAGLDEYLQMVQLYGDKNEISQGDYLQLMTIHAAKGLEFDTVFVIGLSEGIFPSERTMEEGKRGLEEERRLAYVAFTRAKNKLYLSEVTGFSFVLNRVRMRSRFIEEISDKHVDHIGINYDYHNPREINMNRKMVTTAFPEPTQKSEPLLYKVGDQVIHTVFGIGLILSIKGGLAEIAFEYPHGVKQLMAHHPSLSKMEDIYDTSKN